MSRRTSVAIFVALLAFSRGAAFAEEQAPAVTGTAVAVAVAIPVEPAASPSPSPAVSGSSAKIEVNVIGAVSHAGRISIVKEAGVIGAISAAGWFAETGDQKKVKILRKPPGEKSQVFFVNIPQILSGEQPDILLVPEDTIYISQRMVNF